jgi:uncharacterized protein involved in exopolysaccharide biosynthesis
MIANARFYLRLLLRRLHYMIFFLALGTVIGVSLSRTLPPTFRANALLVVESEQIPNNLAASTVQTEAVEQLQIIQRRILTRGNLLDMADRFDVYARDPRGRLGPDEIVSDMRGRIRINTDGGGGRRRQGPQATLVSVSFSAPSSELAAAVTNEVVTLITQEDVRMRTGVSGETLEFFEQEEERLERALRERSLRIVAFQSENQDALPENLEFRRSQLTILQERLLQLDRDARALRDRRDDLARIYEATGRLDSVPSTEAQTVEEQELTALQRQYRADSAVFSEENPRMRLLRNRIASLEAAVERQRTEALASSAPLGADGAPPDPFELQMGEIERQISFLEGQRGLLTAEIETLGETIAETPANAIALDTLRRDYDNVRRQYDQAVSNRARAETGDMIEALSKGERITVIEQATPPARPVSPDRGRLVTAGMGGGLLAGLGLVVLLELLNGAVRRPVEISRKLEIMPIGVLPYIRTRREVRFRRAKILSAFALVLFAVPAGIWAVDTYYMPIDLLAERALDRLPVDRLRSIVNLSATGGL